MVYSTVLLSLMMAAISKKSRKTTVLVLDPDPRLFGQPDPE